jgi:hypothetical protein
MKKLALDWTTQPVGGSKNGIGIDVQYHRRVTSHSAMIRCLPIILAIWPLVGCGIGTDDRFSVTKDPSDPSRVVCDVNFATFAVPKGWTANRSNKNTYALLTRSNESHPNLSQAISIDIGKPVEPSAQATAEAFATEWHGRLEDATLSVDGETGFRVIVAPDNENVKPIDCVVAMKNGRAFLIIAGAKESGEANAAVDQIVASWKWKN